MEWTKLLSTTRLGRDDTQSADVRTEYQRDYDRIVYSSAFRRLQDKTQVFPLAESDYVRTRLTHSIEVSCVGRSLGTLAGNFVNRSYKTGVLPQEFGNIVAAACLAHDIGNPPFGHSGEEAIRGWFNEHGEGFLKGLSPNQKADFLNFEGNAQGFRVLSRLQNSVDRGGLQLTYAVLGTYGKYPRRAYIPQLATSTNVSEKKFGFVSADAVSFETIAKALGLVKKQKGAWSRHPLAFLMEAADDICYRIIDLEDGHRLGRVSFRETEELLKPVAFGSTEVPKKGSYALIDDESGKVEYLRARAINSLISEVVSAFEQNYEAIIAGSFENDLLSQTKYITDMNAIKVLSKKKVYATPTVLHIEAAGFEVIGGLLQKIVPALVAADSVRTAAEKKTLELVPTAFVKKGKSQYEKLLGATDYVSGMTDSYAVTLYRRMRGIELPRG